MAATRLVLDLHWLSDIFVALLFGVALRAFFLAVRERLPRHGLPVGAAVQRFRGSGWAWFLTAAAALVAVVPPLFEPAA